MIKRLLKKNTEQFVKKFEYYRVALQKEMDTRQKSNRSAKERQNIPNSSHSFSHNYPPPNSVLPNGISHTNPPPPLYPYPPRMDSSQNSGHNPGIKDHAKATPSNKTGDRYNTMSSSNAIINNYQQHTNFTQHGSTYFNSNSENTTMNIVDAYDGLPETFV